MTDVPYPTFITWELHQGQTLRETVTLPDDGASTDITGWATRGYFRKTYKGTVVLTGTTWVSNGPLREITVELTATQTAAATSDLICDVEAESPLGEVRRANYVTVLFYPEVTYS